MVVSQPSASIWLITFKLSGSLSSLPLQQERNLIGRFGELKMFNNGRTGHRSGRLEDKHVAINSVPLGRRPRVEGVGFWSILRLGGASAVSTVVITANAIGSTTTSKYNCQYESVHERGSESEVDSGHGGAGCWQRRISGPRLHGREGSEGRARTWRIWQTAKDRDVWMFELRSAASALEPLFSLPLTLRNGPIYR